MKKKIGVVLSGCGVYDGAEVHESVLTLLAIDRAGAEAVCMAPTVDQMHVVNHLTGDEVSGEKRNVLVESARIARGNVKDIASVKTDDIDALIFPGGFGAAKNLCDFAVKGENCSVHPEVIRLVREFADKKKPQAACCIAPAMYAKVFEGQAVQPALTIGNDKEVGGKIEGMGSKHQECSADDMVFDEVNNIVSTPAYMVGQGIAEVATGIEKTVNKLVSLL
ncbi:MAG: isoprenoid biosynthesis glyoxalase ElbB [Nitrospinota bacterium]|nr:isoprenoid biosynthesis glyoxalase ElbB [Nitrospinota bacterium]